MKNFKKIGALIVAIMLVLAMAVPAFATEAPAPTTGTITVENATYGKTYKAYKIFDATYDSDDATKISYTVPEAKKSFVSTDLFNISTAADSDGNYTVSKKDGVTDDQIINWVKSNYTNFTAEADAVTGDFNTLKNQVTFDVPYGYYYITTTLGTQITIDSNNPNVTVKDKNASAPTKPVKTVVTVDGTALSGTDLKEADAHVGSVIGYKITGNATNWTTSGSGTSVTTTQNLTYTFKDTFTNMTLDADGDNAVDNLVVKVNGAAITSNYTAVISGDKVTFTINLTDGGTATGAVLYPANGTGDDSAYIPIEITYNGTILATAGDAPATNEIGDEIVKVYTYAFQVAKTDGTDPLPGAQFELWYNGAALTFIDNKDGSYTYYVKTGASDTTEVTTTLDMTTNTTILVKGLDNRWTYTLKEITVPKGYNQAEDTTIAGSSLTKVTEGMNPTPATTGLYKETVVNNSGTELPATGGIGTRIFYIVGAILALGAGIVLVSRRRAGDR